MQNFLFKYNGNTYITLFGVNYLNKKIEDVNNLPTGVIEAAKQILASSAEIDNAVVSKDFNRNLVATATIRFNGKTYYLDTANTVTPLREIESSSEPTQEPLPEPEPEPTPEPTPEPEPEPIPEPTPASTPEPIPEPTPAPESTPVTEPTPEPEPEPVPEPVPEPASQPKWEHSLLKAMDKVEEKPESHEEEVKVTEEDLTPAWNPVYLQRIEAYSLAPISMDEVAQKGDAYCEMNKWAKIDDLYMIDDVVSVVRCIHSDAHNINIVIPYEEVANYGKN